MFLNAGEKLLSSSVETRYLINDPVQAKALGNANLQYQDFNNHWMTITKFYRDNNNGDTAVAFSSWGQRFSINTKLLQYTNSTNYYPDFYVYEIYKK